MVVDFCLYTMTVFAPWRLLSITTTERQLCFPLTPRSCLPSTTTDGDDDTPTGEFTCDGVEKGDFCCSVSILAVCVRDYICSGCRMLAVRLGGLAR